MPRTGGIYSLPNGYQAVTGETIQPSQHNPPLEDIAQALTDSLPRNGSAAMNGNLPLNGNRITGLAPAIAPNHAARWDQVLSAGGGTVTGIITIEHSAQNMMQFMNTTYNSTRYAYIRVTNAGSLSLQSPLPGVGGYFFGDPVAAPATDSHVITRWMGDGRYVPLTRTIATGDGLSGGGNLTANRTLSVNNTVVRTTRQVNTGTGLAGGGDLSDNLTLSLALGDLPFSGDTVSEPRAIMLDGTNNNTQVRVSGPTFRENFNIPPTSLTISAGDGLSGGGDLSANRTLSVDGTVVRTSRLVSTGAGLSGGGDLSANRTLSVDGTWLDNRTSGQYAPLSRTISTGTGLTGGGDLSANRTLSISIPSTGQAQAGTNNTTVMTPLRVAEASIGSSQQAWTGVTGSRTGNTVYQNTTGRPIEMRCLASASGGSAIVQVSSNGSTGWTPVGWYVSDSSQSQGAIVPNGHYYRINHAGSLNITSWAELR